MFTGLVEGCGTVVSVKKNDARLVIQIPPMRDLKVGDSLAIDGCCLTVVTKKSREAQFEVSTETLKRTIIGSYKKGTKVNLERPLRPIDRLGGHFVLGHVDGLGVVQNSQQKSPWQVTRFTVKKDVGDYLIAKGSITINGVSLTVSDVKKNSFAVYLIPETLRKTNLGKLKIGDVVNVEADMLGKYVKSFMK